MGKDFIGARIMRKILIISLAALFFTGCSGRDKFGKFTPEQMKSIPQAVTDGLPDPCGGFVLSIGGETLNSDEVVLPLVQNLQQSQFNEDYAYFGSKVRPIVEQMTVNRIADLLLYQKAKTQAGGDIDEALDKAVEIEVRKFVASFGGDWAKAEEQVRAMGKNWAEFREYQRKLLLSQSYVALSIEVKYTPTYKELVTAYDEMKDASFKTPDSLTLRVIDIQPEMLDVNDPNANKLQAAKQLAQQLLARIKAGEDFGKLAREYSTDHRKDFDGLWKPIMPSSLAAPYDILAAKAADMQIGQIGGPFESQGHIFIIKVEDKKPVTYEPFEKVQNQIEAKITLDKKIKMIDQMSGDIVKGAQIANKSAFVDFCVNRIYKKVMQ